MERLQKSQAGFTLVELSIVLVVIGLIVSSVLVGQTLVRSGELRASITQLEGFNAAVATFRGKYNGLPGDVAGATSFGFTGDGDNNAVFRVSSNGTTTTGLTAAENVYFWNHLGSTGAGLISGAYSGAAVTSANIATMLPAAKAGNYWGVYAGPATTTVETQTSGSEAGTNYYMLGVLGGTAGQYLTTPTLTPLEAQGIDSKVDDGKPSTGLVRARGGATDAADTVPTSAVSSGASTSVCTYFVATSYTTAISTNTYNSKNGITPLCTLRIKMP